MPTSPELFLDVLARALRRQIGPAVEDPYARTQAFMAAVILEKLAGQLGSAAADELAAERDRTELVADLRAELGESPPEELRQALDALTCDGSDANWCSLVRAVYASRETLGPARFDRTLGRTRSALRAQLNRTLAYAS